jgi:hypothetical protein
MPAAREGVGVWHRHWHGAAHGATAPFRSWQPARRRPVCCCARPHKDSQPLPGAGYNAPDGPLVKERGATGSAANFEASTPARVITDSQEAGLSET